MYLARRISLVVLVVGLLAPGVLLGQARGRIWGLITDENGVPLQGVKVTVLELDENIYSQQKTNKKGRYTVALVDSTRPYIYRFEMEGYRTVEEQIKVPVLSNLKRDFTLYSWSYLREQGSSRGDIESTGSEDAPVDPISTTYNEGVEAVEQEDYDLAEEKFLKVIEMAPRLNAGYSALGRIHLIKKRYDAAIEAADRALELEAGDEAALSVRYQAYTALGDKANAEKAYQELAKKTAPDIVAYNLGVDAFKARNFELAKEKFLEALALESELVPAHTALARVHRQLGDYPAAAAAIERALAHDSKNVDALAFRYDVYRQIGDSAKIDEARSALQAVAPERLSGDFFDKGVKLFNANQMVEAHAAFLEVVAADPAHARAHYMLGLLFVNTGNSDKAREHLETYLKLAPEDPDAGTAREMIKYLNP